MMRGGSVKAYIETPDGSVYEIPGVIVDMTMQQDLNSHFGVGPEGYTAGFQTIDVNIRGYNFIRHNDRGIWNKRIAERTSAAEWLCDYCRGANPRDYRKCGNCGAVRSFIYG
jgi:hypothetical protein